MTLRKLFKSVPVLCLMTGLISCDKSNDYYDHPESIKVMSVDLSAGFDLSARSNWLFYVGGKRYDCEIIGNKITAVPYNASGTFEFSVTSQDKSGRVALVLAPEDYGKTRSEVIPPTIENQSTPEKFMACDRLVAQYSGLARESLTGITLYHENALLAFKTINIPSEAEIYVEQKYSQKIMPLRDPEDPTAYKAIVLPGNEAYDIVIHVDVNGKVYKQQLSSLTRANISLPPGIGTSAVVTFTVQIDENDKLVINDLKRERFAKEWPVSQ